MALVPGPFNNVSGTPVTPQFAQVSWIGHTVEGNTTIKACNQVTYWRTATPAAGGNMGGLASTLQTQFGALVQACAADSYTLDIIRAKFIDNPLTIPVDNPVNLQGAVTTDRAASFTAAVIRKNTTVPSRNFRGSIHYGALPETFTTTDRLNATGQTAFNALLAAWNAAVVNGVNDSVQLWFPIVLSPTLSNMFANPGIYSGAAVTTHTLNLRLGTMKRRKEK